MYTLSSNEHKRNYYPAMHLFHTSSRQEGINTRERNARVSIVVRVSLRGRRPQTYTNECLAVKRMQSGSLKSANVSLSLSGSYQDEYNLSISNLEKGVPVTAASTAKTQFAKDLRDSKLKFDFNGTAEFLGIQALNISTKEKKTVKELVQYLLEKDARSILLPFVFTSSGTYSLDDSFASGKYTIDIAMDNFEAINNFEPSYNVPDKLTLHATFIYT